ncbi:DUF6879 family protein [Streptosporangium sp. NPDC087985]|uniref:DUF6879 family protein n=1 Tax=Streptosporangium sp. NPDC087985 TaxID=3366196 RepID=UPI00380833EC
MNISDDAFEELLAGFEHSAVHLEMRDAYGAAVELPYMARCRVVSVAAMPLKVGA